jgi:hypothetical protein
VPVYDLAPLEYRLGLDAASVWLARHSPVLLICEQPALRLECLQRLPVSHDHPGPGVLWLEPQRQTWRSVLTGLDARLASGAHLALLLSLPLARRLPECRIWDGNPLGQQPGGLQSLLHALHQHGLIIEVAQALHTRRSILTNASARLARTLGLHALADRLEFAARRHYIQPLKRSWQATCALILALRP